MLKKRILVCGGRDFDDWEAFRDHMALIAEEKFQRTEEIDGNYLYDVTIISGGAKGADTLAADWATIEWTRYEEFPANWDKYGKKAGPIRNQQMLDEGKPDLVIAFPGGVGTADMVRRAKKAGIELVEIKNEKRIKR